MFINKSIIFNLLPVRFQDFVIGKIYLETNGWILSKKENRPISKTNDPIPWFTYPSIQFLKTLNLQRFRVLEFGAGFSSLYFATHAKSLKTYEKNDLWRNELIKINPHLDISLLEAEPDYSRLLNNDYDILVIDGNDRVKIAESLIKNYSGLNNSNLKLIIFDNADWYPECVTSLAQKLGMIPISFTGVAPSNNYESTTTFLFSAKVENLNGIFSITKLTRTNQDESDRMIN